jgi:hypothetical protein
MSFRHTAELVSAVNSRELAYIKMFPRFARSPLDRTTASEASE